MIVYFLFDGFLIDHFACDFTVVAYTHCLGPEQGPGNDGFLLLYVLYILHGGRDRYMEPLLSIIPIPFPVPVSYSTPMRYSAYFSFGTLYFPSLCVFVQKKKRQSS